MLPPNPHPLSFPDANHPLVSPGTIYPLFCFAYLVYPVGFPRFIRVTSLDCMGMERYTIGWLRISVIRMLHGDGS
jgi:hypothetical protein